MKIARRIALMLFITSLAGVFSLPAARAAEGPGVSLGSLTCKTLPGTRVRLLLSSSVAIECTFKTAAGQEQYKGEIGFLGVDLSKKSEETLHFTVLGLAADIKMGSHSLAGGYAGASVAAGLVEKGYGSTQFVGGVKKSLSLVPSIDTFKGTGISAGVSRMHLEPKK